MGRTTARYLSSTVRTKWEDRPHVFYRRLQHEWLEPRLMLSAVADPESLLPPDAWTVILHGLTKSSYDDLTGNGGWMMNLGKKLWKESPNVAVHRLEVSGGAWAGSLDTLIGDGVTRLDSNDNWIGDAVDPQDSSFHHVLLFDWTRVSNYDVQDKFTGLAGLRMTVNPDSDIPGASGDDGYAEAAADSLYTLLRWLPGVEHALIGYSRGAVVTSEVAQRLLLDEDPQNNVEQVIYLDAEGGGLSSQHSDPDFGLYFDDRYWAWSGTRTDNYYGTVHETLFLPWDFGGHSVDGSREHNDGDNYSHGDFPSYLIGDGEPTNGRELDGLTIVDGLIVTKDTPDAITGTTKAPDSVTYDPPDSLELFNGDFEFNSTAGWWYNGGDGPTDDPYALGAVVAMTDADHALALQNGQSRTHNWTWVPHDARSLALDLHVVQIPSTPAQFRVSWAGQDGIFAETLATVPMSAENSGWSRYRFDLPDDLNNTPGKLRLELHSDDAATVWVDNIRWSEQVVQVAGADTAGFYRTTDSTFHLRDSNDVDGATGVWYQWGSQNNNDGERIPLIGDWNGDGYDEIGVRQPDGRFLLDVDGSGNWTTGDRTYFWGMPADEPFVGDWDGDGDDEIGVRQADGRFLLDADGSGRWSAGDQTFFWSFPNDMVLIGDWDGDGDDTIGVRRTDGRFLLDVDGSGRWSAGDQTFFWGSPTDTVLIGDWDGDGDDTIGVRWADGRFVLDVDGSGRWSAGDRTFFWGSPTDTILTGDWDGDGDDTIGVRWPDGRYVLDVDGSGQWSAGDRTYFWGLTTDTPIVGNWAPASPLMAAESATGNDPLAPLSDEAVAPLVETVIAAWSAQSLSAAQAALLDRVQVQIADLPGLTLGQAVGTSITLDIDGAGWGWFIDATPDDDCEFVSGDQGSSAGSAQRMDLLTVVLHELGHVLGYGHDDDFDVLLDTLAVGVRRGL